MEITPGTFQKFKAITKLHLGGTNPPMDIMPGMVIEYDGSSTKISGQLYNVPSIAGALRVGWLIPIDDTMTNYVPQPAGVQVRPATSASQERGAAMVIERAVDDERQVGSLGDSNARRADVQANQFSSRQASQAQVSASGTIRTAEQNAPEPKKYQVYHEDPPVEISYPLGQADRNRTRDPSSIKVDDSHNEGARVAAQLRPAKMGAIDVSDSRALQTVLRDLDPVMGVKAPIIKVATVSRTNQDAVGGVPMNQNFANGATGDVEFATAGDDLEDILQGAVSAGRPSPGPVMGSDDHVEALKPRYVPTAIEWDKTVHWRTRVKVALEKYSDDPDALQYILSVEDSAVVKFIEDGLSKLG
jgi:hypothetical protein